MSSLSSESTAPPVLSDMQGTLQDLSQLMRRLEAFPMLLTEFNQNGFSHPESLSMMLSRLLGLSLNAIRLSFPHQSEEKSVEVWRFDELDGLRKQSIPVAHEVYTRYSGTLALGHMHQADEAQKGWANVLFGQPVASYGSIPMTHRGTHVATLHLGTSEPITSGDTFLLQLLSQIMTPVLVNEQQAAQLQQTKDLPDMASIQSEREQHQRTTKELAQLRELFAETTAALKKANEENKKLSEKASLDFSWQSTETSVSDSGPTPTLGAGMSYEDLDLGSLSLDGLPLEPPSEASDGYVATAPPLPHSAEERSQTGSNPTSHKNTGSHQLPHKGSGGMPIAHKSTGSHSIPHKGTGGHSIPHKGTGGHSIPHKGTGSHSIPHKGTGGHSIPHKGTGPLTLPPVESLRSAFRPSATPPGKEPADVTSELLLVDVLNEPKGMAQAADLLDDIEVEEGIPTLLCLEEAPSASLRSVARIIQSFSFRIKPAATLQHLQEIATETPPTVIGLTTSQIRKSSAFIGFMKDPTLGRRMPLLEAADDKKPELAAALHWSGTRSAFLPDTFWHSWLRKTRNRSTQGPALGIGFSSDENLRPLLGFFCEGAPALETHLNPVDGIQQLYQSVPMMLFLLLEQDQDNWVSLLPELSRMPMMLEVPILLQSQTPPKPALIEALKPFSSLLMLPPPS